MKAIIKHKRTAGVTLIEIMIATVVIVIAVVGAAGFRYYSTIDAIKADEQITAARLAWTLLEGWKAAGAAPDYDQRAAFGSGLTLSSAGWRPVLPDGFTPLASGNCYKIPVSGIDYHAMLSYKDVTGRPRMLNICVAWRDQRLPQLTSTSGETATASNYRSVSLTTYEN